MTMTSSSRVFLLVIALLLLKASCDLKQDAVALRYFINGLERLPSGSKYNWTESESEDPCTWDGVVCSKSSSGENIAVIGIRLPAARLVGQIRSDSIGKIVSLRALSLRENALNGSLPDDFVNLVSLTHVYLHLNKFSGHFPWAKWTNLVAVDLSNNSFSGKFDNVASRSIVKFNVSNNDFSGTIPSSLARFGAPAFAGNFNLCGKPLSNTCDGTNDSSTPSDSMSSNDDNKKKKLSTGHIVAIAVGSGFILLISSLCLGKKWRRAVKDKKAQGVATMAAAAAAKAGEAGKSFSKDDVTSASMEGQRNK